MFRLLKDTRFEEVRQYGVPSARMLQGIAIQGLPTETNASLDSMLDWIMSMSNVTVAIARNLRSLLEADKLVLDEFPQEAGLLAKADYLKLLQKAMLDERETRAYKKEALRERRDLVTLWMQNNAPTRYVTIFEPYMKAVDELAASSDSRCQTASGHIVSLVHNVISRKEVGSRLIKAEAPTLDTSECTPDTLMYFSADRNAVTEKARRLRAELPISPVFEAILDEVERLIGLDEYLALFAAELVMDITQCLSRKREVVGVLTRLMG
jgi:hypothetical protein